jgi:hypothetical protein
MTSSHHPAAFAAELQAILKEGTEEVLGLEEANALFERLRASTLAENEAAEVDPGKEMARLHSFMEEEYGSPAARGLALRVGRAGFRRALKRWGLSAGLLEPSYRLLPSGKRIYTGLAGMAQALEMMFGMGVEVGQTEAQWTWRMAQQDWNSGRPIRSFMVGTLQEYLSWAGSGRIYQVRELDSPNAYLFVIDKMPLDG